MEHRHYVDRRAARVELEHRLVDEPMAHVEKFGGINDVAHLVERRGVERDGGEHGCLR
jgi:hypothetical protein